tara:strand:- start:203 stop:604 length:402 start_codon:yes stop_codon:yes gene_type:complete
MVALWSLLACVARYVSFQGAADAHLDEHVIGNVDADVLDLGPHFIHAVLAHVVVEDEVFGQRSWLGLVAVGEHGPNVGGSESVLHSLETWGGGVGRAGLPCVSIIGAGLISATLTTVLVLRSRLRIGAMVDNV